MRKPSSVTTRTLWRIQSVLLLIFPVPHAAARHKRVIRDTSSRVPIYLFVVSHCISFVYSFWSYLGKPANVLFFSFLFFLFIKVCLKARHGQWSRSQCLKPVAVGNFLQFSPDRNKRLIPIGTNLLWFVTVRNNFFHLFIFYFIFSNWNRRQRKPSSSVVPINTRLLIYLTFCFLLFFFFFSLSLAVKGLLLFPTSFTVVFPAVHVFSAHPTNCLFTRHTTIISTHRTNCL